MAHRTTDRFLSGRDFAAALDLLEARGINQTDLCLNYFECSRHQPNRWREIGAPRYIALALTAILEDRPPWKPEKRKR